MKTILKKTQHVAIAKVSGTNVTETITLSQDLLQHNQIISGASSVGVMFLQWNVSSGTSDRILITRGGTEICTLGQNSGKMDMQGSGGYRDNINTTSDIQVQIFGTGNAYITLRKISGYSNTGEPTVDDTQYVPMNMGWIQQN